MLNTKEAMLIEYNTGSNYWGVNSKMIGENHLGRIIMSVRNFYNSLWWNLSIYKLRGYEWIKN